MGSTLYYQNKCELLSGGQWWQKWEEWTARRELLVLALSSNSPPLLFLPGPCHVGTHSAPPTAYEE